jgi:hypothetical protein
VGITVTVPLSATIEVEPKHEDRRSNFPRTHPGR